MNLDSLTTTLEMHRPGWEALGFDFSNGNCHDLACALLETFNTGRLLAGCHFVYTDDDYTRKPTSYYHMVYQDINDSTWDIDGKNAIEDWEEAYGAGDFMWIPIQRADLESWLIAHNATLHHEVVETLKQHISNAYTEYQLSTHLTLRDANCVIL